MASTIWVNYNELTTSSLEIMVSKGNHPQMAARFRLVKYYNLPRILESYSWECRVVRLHSCPFWSHTHIGDATQKECRTNKQLVQWLCWSDVTWARILLICSPGYLKTNATKKEVSMFPTCISIWDGTNTMFYCFIFHFAEVVSCIVPIKGHQDPRAVHPLIDHHIYRIWSLRWIPVMRLLK